MSASMQLRLTGGAANSDPAAALGGVMSSEQVSAVALNNLFDNVSPAEAEAGDVEYRAIDVYNAGDATATSVTAYLGSETTSPSTQLDIGHDATNDPHATDWDGETIADESAAPAAPVVAFDHHLAANKLSLPDIPAGQACRLWLRRTVTALADNLSNDQGTLTVEYA